MKYFRNNPLIDESFTGENHFLVFCNQRIILLSLVIFVDHDWNVNVGVLWLDTFTLPVCPGLRKDRHLPFNELNTIVLGIHARVLDEDEEISVKGAL